MTTVRTALAGLALLALTGCGGSGGIVNLTAEDVDPWPLTVRTIAVTCSGEEALWGTAEGEQYALNGTAQSSLGYPSIDALRVEGGDVGPLLDAARGTC